MKKKILILASIISSCLSFYSFAMEEENANKDNPIANKIEEININNNNPIADKIEEININNNNPIADKIKLKTSDNIINTNKIEEINIGEIDKSYEIYVIDIILHRIAQIDQKNEHKRSININIFYKETKDQYATNIENSADLLKEILWFTNSVNSNDSNLKYLLNISRSDFYKNLKNEFECTKDNKITFKEGALKNVIEKYINKKDVDNANWEAFKFIKQFILINNAFGKKGWLGTLRDIIGEHMTLEKFKKNLQENIFNYRNPIINIIKENEKNIDKEKTNKIEEININNNNPIADKIKLKTSDNIINTNKIEEINIGGMGKYYEEDIEDILRTIIYKIRETSKSNNDIFKILKLKHKFSEIDNHTKNYNNVNLLKDLIEFEPNTTSDDLNNKNLKYLLDISHSDFYKDLKDNFECADDEKITFKEGSLKNVIEKYIKKEKVNIADWNAFTFIKQFVSINNKLENKGWIGVIRRMVEGQNNKDAFIKSSLEILKKYCKSIYNEIKKNIKETENIKKKEPSIIEETTDIKYIKNVLDKSYKNILTEYDVLNLIIKIIKNIDYKEIEDLNRYEGKLYFFNYLVLSDKTIKTIKDNDLLKKIISSETMEYLKKCIKVVGANRNIFFENGALRCALKSLFDLIYNNNITNLEESIKNDYNAFLFLKYFIIIDYLLIDEGILGFIRNNFICEHKKMSEEDIRNSIINKILNNIKNNELNKEEVEKLSKEFPLLKIENIMKDINKKPKKISKNLQDEEKMLKKFNEILKSINLENNEEKYLDKYNYEIFIKFIKKLKEMDDEKYKNSQLLEYAEKDIKSIDTLNLNVPIKSNFTDYTIEILNYHNSKNNKSNKAKTKEEPQLIKEYPLCYYMRYYLKLNNNLPNGIIDYIEYIKNTEYIKNNFEETKSN